MAGATTGASTTITLQAYGATVGCLTYRPPERQLSAAEQRLVRDLARQLGGALHARLLREDLQRARERLVMAREEEDAAVCAATCTTASARHWPG